MSQVETGEHEPVTWEVLRLFAERGSSEYGGEAVTQLQHALQAAVFAERQHATPALIVAALLHDIGHLLHGLPEDAPDQGIDDYHEALAGRWLKKRFGSDVAEPVRLHVAAKRYLCATDPDYFQQLSPPSVQSLKLQGGPMSREEVQQFALLEFCTPAVTLRRWDDAAKDPAMITPPLDYFAAYIDQVIRSHKR